MGNVLPFPHVPTLAYRGRVFCPLSLVGTANFNSWKLMLLPSPIKLMPHKEPVPLHC